MEFRIQTAVSEINLYTCSKIRFVEIVLKGLPAQPDEAYRLLIDRVLFSASVPRRLPPSNDLEPDYVGLLKGSGDCSEHSALQLYPKNLPPREGGRQSSMQKTAVIRIGWRFALQMTVHMLVDRGEYQQQNEGYNNMQ